MPFSPLDGLFLLHFIYRIFFALDEWIHRQKKGELHQLSWLDANGKRGNYLKAKKGENLHGYSNNENEKSFEKLMKMTQGDKGSIKKFFTPAPKKW